MKLQKKKKKRKIANLLKELRIIIFLNDFYTFNIFSNNNLCH
jgi:hypothetical protein